MRGVYLGGNRKVISYLDDEEVRVDDQEQGGEVDEHGVDQDVRAAHPVLGQVVGSASGHVAFRHIPEEEGKRITVIIEVTTMKMVYNMLDFNKPLNTSLLSDNINLNML